MKLQRSNLYSTALLHSIPHGENRTVWRQQRIKDYYDFEIEKAYTALEFLSRLPNW